MSGKRVIRLGDPTTHGGTVVSASGTVIINGKQVARVGDSVTCPIPGHGVVTIIEGDTTWLDDGRPIALEGHKTSCGASLISTLPTFTRSPEGSGEVGKIVGAAGVAGALANDLSANQRTGRFDEHFVLQNQTTGDAVSGFAYGIETRSGEHHDQSYEDGATVKAYSTSPIPVRLLYVMQTEVGLR